MFHDFNVLQRNKDDMDGDQGGEQLVHYDDLADGYSGGEGQEDAFDRTFPGSNPTKGKKCPRSFQDDDSTLEHSLWAKGRVKSLFGGPSLPDEGADDKQPKTLGPGIIGISSLKTKQKDSENSEESSKLPFNLGATFDSSMEISPTPSEHSSTFDDYNILPPATNEPVRSYGLRKHIDRQAGGTTYLDIDQSGNYNPLEEAAKNKASKLSKAKAKKRKKKGKQKNAPIEKPPRWIVKLHFAAFGNVLNITNNDEHWPEGHSVMDSEDEREMEEFRSFYRRRTPGRMSQEPILDPRGECNDITGYPAARGCKDCRRHNRVCSMISDGKWPCTLCDKHGLLCDPIIERNMKQGRCSRCDELGTACSFEEGNDTSGICDECLEAGCIDCTASWPISYMADRVDLTRILYGPDRKHVTCTNCRIHNKRCSIKKPEDQGPCKNCKRHNIGCTFFDIPPLEVPQIKEKKAPKGPEGGVLCTGAHEVALELSILGSEFFSAEDLEDLERQDEDDPMREDTPEIEIEDAEGRTGLITKLQTSFAHPIEFHAMDNDLSICNFCEIPIFGIVGHWEKTVHVLKWTNGLGYTEVAAGHREMYDATIMCQRCIMSRVQVVFCPAHEFHRIGDVDLDRDEAANQLLVSEPGSVTMRHELQRWCSMCFSLATYKCCTPQPPIMDQIDDNQGLIEGCGLRLCEDCGKKLHMNFGGDFETMVTAFGLEPKATENISDEQVPIRADVSFLGKGGLLMANVRHTSGFCGEGDIDAGM